MLAHRIETIVNQDKTLVLENLPFHSGEQVEVIILSRSSRASGQNRYPLRGVVIQYTDPTEPVAQDDWEVYSRVSLLRISTKIKDLFRSIYFRVDRDRTKKLQGNRQTAPN
jgi:hypothetical protein